MVEEIWGMQLVMWINIVEYMLGILSDSRLVVVPQI